MAYQSVKSKSEQRKPLRVLRGGGFQFPRKKMQGVVTHVMLIGFAEDRQQHARPGSAAIRKAHSDCGRSQRRSISTVYSTSSARCAFRSRRQRHARGPCGWPDKLPGSRMLCDLHFSAHHIRAKPLHFMPKRAAESRIFALRRGQNYAEQSN